MKPHSPLRVILRYALVATPVAVLVFLIAGRFFVSWDGHIVAVRPMTSPDPTHLQVLILAVDRSEQVVQWPIEVLEGRDVPMTGILAPPPKIPDTAPHTRSLRPTSSRTSVESDSMSNRIKFAS